MIKICDTKYHLYVPIKIVFTIEYFNMDLYAKKLIDNLSLDSKNNISIDLVLDGGVFNGSYLVGALYFLKEMENRKMVTVKRISGCSIGSLNAFLYIINRLDILLELYKPICDLFKKNHNLKLITNLHCILDKYIPDDICDIVNKKLYICYYSLPKRKKYIKSFYKNKFEIVNSIIRSCFVPYLINGNLTYENKYIDGLNPFIFNSKKGRKILFLDLYGYDKIFHILNIKNEKSNIHRALSGMLDIHNFFIKNAPTHMCSYVHNWSLFNNIFFIIKICLEKFIILIIYIYSKCNFPLKKNNFFRKLLFKLINDTIILLLENYCF